MVIFRIYSVGVFYVKYFHCNCQISLYFFHWVVFALEKRGSKAGIGIANPEFRLSKIFMIGEFQANLVIFKNWFSPIIRLELNRAIFVFERNQLLFVLCFSYPSSDLCFSYPSTHLCISKNTLKSHLNFVRKDRESYAFY